MFDSAYQIAFKFQGILEGKNLAKDTCAAAAAVVAKLLPAAIFTVSAHLHTHTAAIQETRIIYWAARDHLSYLKACNTK